MNIKICPKCQSLDIKIRWQSGWFVGFPATYRCNSCGYISYLFPKVSEKELKKLETLKNRKFLARRKKRVFRASCKIRKWQ